jgi:hypothetical protein
MTEYLMNPVNRQYFERANLFRQMGLIGTHCSQNGLQKGAFSGVATGIHSASGHFKLL